MKAKLSIPLPQIPLPIACCNSPACRTEFPRCYGTRLCAEGLQTNRRWGGAGVASQTQEDGLEATGDPRSLVGVGLLAQLQDLAARP